MPGRTIDPLLRGILIELGVIVLLSLLLFAGLRIMNSRLGLSDAQADQEALDGDIPVSDSLVVPLPESTTVNREEQVAELPQTSWPATPCSLFVSAGSTAVVVQLPEAPATSDIPLETMLLVEAWAACAGFEDTQLERVFAFPRSDTLYADLPGTYDPSGLARTVEGRFVNYTRLIPMVSGCMISYVRVLLRTPCWWMPDS